MALVTTPRRYEVAMNDENLDRLARAPMDADLGFRSED
jgi:hypothetical protein